MDSSRPYNPDQLHELTEHIREHGPIIAPLTLEEKEARQAEAAEEARAKLAAEAGVSVDDLPTGPDPRHEYQPLGTIAEKMVAVLGVGRVLTRRGRAEIRANRAASQNRRQNVANFIADRIRNPRTTGELKENIGWVGSHKPEVDDPILAPLQKKEFKTDFNNLGKTIFPTSEDKKIPNDLRPRNKSEEAIDKRLEKHIQKERRFRGEANWLKKDLPDPTKKATLAPGEKRHVRKLKKRISKLERKVASESAKFDHARTSRNGLSYHARNAHYHSRQIDEAINKKVLKYFPR